MNTDDPRHMDPGVTRAMLWCSAIVFFGLLFAQGYMMGFVPSHPPSLPADELARYFVNNKASILIGAVVLMISWTFWIMWTVAITGFIRQTERGMPLLTYASLIINGGGYVFFLLIPMTWAVMAFRAATLPPAVVQIMNDWVWFDWLYTWPPFALWMVIIAVAILKDRNPSPVFPRWLAWYNVWSAVCIFPAGLIGFFKTGPFAYNGLISFWWDVAVFFGWIIIMTVMGFRAVAVQEAERSELRRSNYGNLAPAE